MSYDENQNNEISSDEVVTTVTSESSGKGKNPAATIFVVILFLILLAIVGIWILLQLGPAVGNVFSDIVTDLPQQ